MKLLVGVDSTLWPLVRFRRGLDAFDQTLMDQSNLLPQHQQLKFKLLLNILSNESFVSHGIFATGSLCSTCPKRDWKSLDPCLNTALL